MVRAVHKRIDLAVSKAILALTILGVLGVVVFGIIEARRPFLATSVLPIGLNTEGRALVHHVQSGFITSFFIAVWRLDQNTLDQVRTAGGEFLRSLPINPDMPNADDPVAFDWVAVSPDAIPGETAHFEGPFGLLITGRCRDDAPNDDLVAAPVTWSEAHCFRTRFEQQTVIGVFPETGLVAVGVGGGNWRATSHPRLPAERMTGRAIRDGRVTLAFIFPQICITDPDTGATALSQTPRSRHTGFWAPAKNMSLPSAS